MRTRQKIELLCCIELKDSQLYNHLTPIALQPGVRCIWIVRSRKGRYGKISNARYILAQSEYRLVRWIRMSRVCWKIARRRPVSASICFNPFPYGFILFLATRTRRIPLHFGFIGSDWNVRSKGILGPIFRRFSRVPDLITVPSQLMKDDMLRNGLTADRISILPHGIDLERFQVLAPRRATYTCICIGDLVSLKKTDVVLRAFSLVVRLNRLARLCVLGDGPLRASLERLARDLGITESVDFRGRVEDVVRFLSQARIILSASESEGLPFAIIEAMCCGLVPIAVAAGGIPEVITDGLNGRLVSAGDYQLMGRRTVELLEDERLYNRLRQGALGIRKSFGFENAAQVWTKWFSRILRPSD